MKTDSSSSQRFSQAIFSLALENNTIDTWLTNFDELEIITSNMMLISFLDKPDLDIKVKTKVIKKIFDKSISTEAFNLIHLLSKRNIVHTLKSIFDHFHQLVDLNNQITRITVESAANLNVKQKTNLEEFLTQFSQGSITTEYVINNSLVGGFIAKIGDRILDASIKTRLKQLNQSLKN